MHAFSPNRLHSPCLHPIKLIKQSHASLQAYTYIRLAKTIACRCVTRANASRNDRRTENKAAASQPRNMIMQSKIRPTDLDVAAPTDVASVLRHTAEQFMASSDEVEAAWQDAQCGKVWRQLAKILERAADRCDKATAKHGFGPTEQKGGAM
jgi:hypothetical protein